MANKYHNIRSGGFDSQKEKRRWQELLLMQRAGKVTDLRRQVPFELVPAQYRDGKCVFRSVKYVADFVYTDDHCRVIVEDVKSEATKKDSTYILKKKLLLWTHGIMITES